MADMLFEFADQSPAPETKSPKMTERGLLDALHSTAPKLADREPISREMLATIMLATAVTAARRGGEA